MLCYLLFYSWLKVQPMAYEKELRLLRVFGSVLLPLTCLTVVVQDSQVYKHQRYSYYRQYERQFLLSAVSLNIYDLQLYGYRSGFHDIRSTLRQGRLGRTGLAPQLDLSSFSRHETPCVKLRSCKRWVCAVIFLASCVSMRQDPATFPRMGRRFLKPLIF